MNSSEFTLNLPVLAIVAVAYMSADIGIPVIIKLAKRWGAVDLAGDHRELKRPIPVLGGMGILLALLVTTGISAGFRLTGKELPLGSIVLAGVFVVVLGLFDDLRPVNAVIKLLFLFLASLLVIACGVRCTLFSQPWGILPNILVSLLWITGITSAFNSVDNTNGAAGGLCAISCVGVLVTTMFQAQDMESQFLIVLCGALLGASLAFLRYNWPKARTYLGDHGSFLVGFVLACALILGKWKESPLKSALIPPVMMTVPLLDIVLSTLLRYKSGIVSTLREAITYCGRDHLAHRLHALGLTPGESSVALWIMGTIFTAEGVFLCRVNSNLLYWGLLGVHLCLTIVLSAIFAKAPVYNKQQLSRAGFVRVLPVSNLSFVVQSRLSVLMDSGTTLPPIPEAVKENKPLSLKPKVSAGPYRFSKPALEEAPGSLPVPTE